MVFVWCRGLLVGKENLALQEVQAQRQEFDITEVIAANMYLYL